MRLCVLGNSHIASLKKGWDQISGAYQGVELVFFASRALGLRCLQNIEGRLVPALREVSQDLVFTSGGYAYVDLKSFDAFLTYGLAFSLPDFDRRVSSAVMKLTCSDIADAALNFSLCQKIRISSPMPIYIGHDPQRALPDAVENLRSNRLDYAATLELMRGAVDRSIAEIQPQPEITLRNAWFTKQEFSVGSARLDVGDKFSNQPHPKGDDRHMNGEFGRVWLESFLSRLH